MLSLNVDQQLLDKLRRSRPRCRYVTRQIRTAGLVETLLRMPRLVRPGRQADFNVKLKREVGFSKRVRRLHSVAFKTRLALVALLEDRTMAFLYHEFDLYANQITNAQSQLLERASDVFGVYASVADARTLIRRYIDGYNTQRPHASLPKSTLAASYEIRWHAPNCLQRQLVRRSGQLCTVLNILSFNCQLGGLFIQPEPPIHYGAYYECHRNSNSNYRGMPCVEPKPVLIVTSRCGTWIAAARIDMFCHRPKAERIVSRSVSRGHDFSNQT